MIDLSVHNFRGLSRARLVDDSPISVIIGPNQSGKTSLAQAVGFAFSGIVSEISDPRQLVRHGYADLRVRLNLPGWTIERSLARGPNVSEIAARLGNIPVKSLPLLFESAATLNYSAHLSAFLNSLENGVGDYSDILRADPDARALFLQALRMRQGKLRSCLYHAKEQGERLSPRLRPAEPRETKPDAEQLETARAELEAATDAHNTAIKTSEVFSVRRNQLAAAREWYFAQERFEDAKSRAGPDCVGEKSLALERLSEVETGWMERTGQLLSAAGREDLSTQLALVRSEIEAAKEQAAQTLSVHGQEAIPKTPEPLPEETQADLRRLGVDSRERLETATKGLAEAERRAHQAVAETRVALSEAQSTMIKLERASAVWRQYEITLAEYEESEIARRRQFDAWNRVALAVQSRLDQTAGCARAQIESLVKRFAGRLLGAEEVSIDPHGRLLTGGLLPALLSASEAWLLGVAVMAAIAARAKAPILVLDGADILDDRSKIALIKWLLSEICPHFAHSILLSTARGDQMGKGTIPFNATKWWIEKGDLSRCGSAPDLAPRTAGFMAADAVRNIDEAINVEGFARAS